MIQSQNLSPTLDVADRRSTVLTTSQSTSVPSPTSYARIPSGSMTAQDDIDHRYRLDAGGGERGVPLPTWPEPCPGLFPAGNGS